MIHNFIFNNIFHAKKYIEPILTPQDYDLDN